MTQITVARISGYGPWTLTLGHDREHRLQMLQASIYAEAQRLFSERGALLFPNRYDEYIVASCGIDKPGHLAIRDAISEKYQMELEMYAGRGATPRRAERAAHASGTLDAAGTDADGVIIMHIDVDNLTGRTAEVSPYGISQAMIRLHLAMSEYFLERESLSFFMGGDNFMVLASERGRAGCGAFLDMARDDLGMKLNCGVGAAPSGREAAMLATKSLDSIREMRDSGAPHVPRIYEADC